MVGLGMGSLQGLGYNQLSLWRAVFTRTNSKVLLSSQVLLWQRWCHWHQNWCFCLMGLWDSGRTSGAWICQHTARAGPSAARLRWAAAPASSTPRQYLELLDSRAPLTQTGVAMGFPFFQKVDSLVTLRIWSLAFFSCVIQQLSCKGQGDKKSD